jgi:hypothetical protein
VEEIRYKILVRKSKGRDHFKDIGINGRIILKGVLRKMGYESVDCRIGTNGRLK